MDREEQMEQEEPRGAIYMEQMEKMDREEQMEQEEPRGAIYILQTNRAIGVIGEQVAEQFGIKSLECNLCFYVNI